MFEIKILLFVPNVLWAYRVQSLQHRVGEVIMIPSAFVIGASPGCKDRVVRLPGWVGGLFTLGWRGSGKLRWVISMQSLPLIQFCSDIQCVKSLFRWNDNMAIVSVSQSVTFRCVWRSVIVLTPIRCSSHGNSMSCLDMLELGFLPPSCSPFSYP